MSPDGDDGAAAELTVAGKACRRALRESLHEDPDAFGLRTAVTAAGERLVAVLDTLRTQGGRAIGAGTATDPHARADEFAARFTDAVAGTGTLVADSAVRRAAANAAAALVDSDTPAAAAVRAGADGGLPITGELFCLLYRTFFADAVGAFLSTAVSAKLRMVFPPLALMPSGTGPALADAVAGHIVGLLPDPCEQAHEDRDERPGSFVDAGRRLLTDTVRGALGLTLPRSPTEAVILVAEAVDARTAVTP